MPGTVRYQSRVGKDRPIPAKGAAASLLGGDRQGGEGNVLRWGIMGDPGTQESGRASGGGSARAELQRIFTEESGKGSGKGVSGKQTGGVMGKWRLDQL